MTLGYSCLADDLTKQMNDPYIFPMKMKNEYMNKIPPMAIQTAEFDFFRKDAEKFASRLRNHGKLLDIVIIPESTHMGHLIPELAEKTSKILDLFIKTWLI